MMKITWNYSKPLKTPNVLEEIEKEYRVAIPTDLKDCIRAHNAGMPNPAGIDVKGRKGLVFGGLFSFNKGDADSFFDSVKNYLGSDGKTLALFPFGLDPAGNVFAVNMKDGSIVFYDHERDVTLPICATFTEFLQMLHP